MKRLILAAALMVILLPGCGEENLQSPFLVRISSINDGFPTAADVQVIDIGPPVVVSVPEDWATVYVTNKPYSPSIVAPPETYWNDFLVTGYRVSWRYADGTPLSGFDFEGGTNMLVPINTTVEMGMLLVPAGMKTVPPFVNAVGGGAFFMLIADVEFWGHPVNDPGTTYRMTASTSVNIADYADED
jgi:hypothetical protein